MPNAELVSEPPDDADPPADAVMLALVDVVAVAHDEMLAETVVDCDGSVVTEVLADAQAVELPVPSSDDDASTLALIRADGDAHGVEDTDAVVHAVANVESVSLWELVALDVMLGVELPLGLGAGVAVSDGPEVPVTATDGVEETVKEPREEPLSVAEPSPELLGEPETDRVCPPEAVAKGVGVAVGAPTEGLGKPDADAHHESAGVDDVDEDASTVRVGVGADEAVTHDAVAHADALRDALVESEKVRDCGALGVPLAESDIAAENFADALELGQVIALRDTCGLRDASEAEAEGLADALREPLADPDGLRRAESEAAVERDGLRVTVARLVTVGVDESVSVNVSAGDGEARDEGVPRASDGEALPVTEAE